ncbi:Ribosomal protein l22 [Globisporangium polare]
MLSAFRSLSLRTASNGACLAAPSSSAAFLQFSTASTTETSSTDEDATAAFLDATAPADERSVKTMKKDIRGSPRKLTYLAQQIRGLPAQEAILQMKFSPKRKAAIIQKTVQNAINLADIKYQIEPENLQVAECFVNKGHFLKRLRIMGRGRSGIMHHPHTHLTVVLREFDPSKKPLNRFLTKKLERETASAAKTDKRDE